MGVKESRTVWSRKIHLPLGEVGLNLQTPFEMEAMVDRLVLAYSVVTVTPKAEEKNGVARTEELEERF